MLRVSSLPSSITEPPLVVVAPKYTCVNGRIFLYIHTLITFKSISFVSNTNISKMFFVPAKRVNS